VAAMAYEQPEKGRQYKGVTKYGLQDATGRKATPAKYDKLIVIPEYKPGKGDGSLGRTFAIVGQGEIKKVPKVPDYYFNVGCRFGVLNAAGQVIIDLDYSSFVISVKG